MVPRTITDIRASLNIPADGVLALSPSRPNLALSVAHVSSASEQDVVALLCAPWLRRAKSIIVYVTMQVRVALGWWLATACVCRLLACLHGLLGRVCASVRQCASVCVSVRHVPGRPGRVGTLCVVWGGWCACRSLTLPRRAVPCRAVPCRAVPCRAVPCRAVPCRARRTKPPP